MQVHKEYIYGYLRVQLRNILDIENHYLKILNKKPEQLLDLTDYVKSVNDCNSSMDKIELDKNVLDNLFQFFRKIDS